MHDIKALADRMLHVMGEEQSGPGMGQVVKELIRRYRASGAVDGTLRAPESLEILGRA